ncbi:uncharacterized protein LOC123588404 [Leopardus geoffroyi]|uniref:uncharacterized protein LOC123588404 n=1 Tax=Leopardus geoffroyi TaxID=46844 RepID=UPI001E2606F9|nr:uncharacterized protein LOC123588404 [Leopardus geoffroyi]
MEAWLPPSCPSWSTGSFPALSCVPESPWSQSVGLIPSKNRALKKDLKRDKNRPLHSARGPTLKAGAREGGGFLRAGTVSSHVLSVCFLGRATPLGLRSVCSAEVQGDRSLTPTALLRRGAGTAKGGSRPSRRRATELPPAHGDLLETSQRHPAHFSLGGAREEGAKRRRRGQRLCAQTGRRARGALSTQRPRPASRSGSLSAACNRGSARCRRPRGQAPVIPGPSLL